MKEKLKTKHLEFEQSAFLIDLVKHNSGVLYVEMTQTIKGNEKESQIIKFNPTVIPEIIKTLVDFQEKLDFKPEKKSVYLSESDQKEIQNRYFKGVSLKDLGVQFDLSEDLIEKVLRNRGVKIVPFEIPKTYYRKRWRKKK